MVRGLVLVLLLPLAAFAQRVVSLAPGVTEIVFAIGAGDRLVGVTRYCDHPPAASRLARVGGRLDLDVEKLMALKPDIVFLYPENRSRLGSLLGSTRLVVVPHRSLADLYEAIRLIAASLGRKSRGMELELEIRSRLAKVAERSRGLPRQRVLLVISRESIQLRNMYLIGRSDFINDILSLAGGENAYEGAVPYPVVSVESVLAMAPAFIVELSAFYEGFPEKGILRNWLRFEQIPAVRKGNIRFVRDNFWLRPGPRVGMLAEELQRLLHPAAGGQI